MGFRFRIEDANWLAHVLHGTGAATNPSEEVDIDGIVNFLESFNSNFISSKEREGEVAKAAYLTASALRRERITSDAFIPIRNAFSRVPWVSLFLPSGDNPTIDDILTSANYLKDMVGYLPDDPGLMLQLSSPPNEDSIALSSVFPAFKLALAEATRWPGLLVWTPTREASFFPLPETRSELIECSRWIYRQLAAKSLNKFLTLRTIKNHYLRTFEGVVDNHNTLKILQLSDIHLGSNVANVRLPRLKTLIRSLMPSQKVASDFLPLVTGDIMHDPCEENYDRARDFCEFMFNLGTLDPIFLLGNHDLRKSGWLDPELQYAIRFPNSPIAWYEKYKVGMLCFNSCIGGNLACGKIGDRQIMDMASLLDKASDKAETFALLASLHHHPVPINIDNLPHKAWYKRMFDKLLENTLELEDAPRFNKWVTDRNIAAVLHGHKHIPRATTVNNVGYIGCGSSTGKVPDDHEGNTNMSINVVTIDTVGKKLSCELKSEVSIGSGLRTTQTYEIIYRKGM